MSEDEAFSFTSIKMYLICFKPFYRFVWMSEDEAFSFTSIKMYLICFSHFIGLFGCLKMRRSVLLALRCILFALAIL